ncbi:hypothetical protein [Nonomuraea africana]|uniref:Uncharacterized protein n=1 Tax=Nonomuraea africana TaxID=46171 RepID=A0ABR9KVE0_9ACTN|nr:hypothetical protein [Nonomuraea africana]MBE1565986.1 hypothetical protein [Nonomuraea africana]
MDMIKKRAVAVVAATALGVAVLFSPIPSYEAAAVELAECRIWVALQRPVLEREVTRLRPRLLPPGSVTAIEREDSCRFDPDADLFPAPSARVVVTVADAHAGPTLDRKLCATRASLLAAGGPWTCRRR